MANSLLPVFVWMESTPLAQTIRNSANLIALLESIHLIGLTILLGTILMVDLSLLGLGIGRSPASRIARELSAWSVAGLVIMLLSGPVLLTSEAIRCYRTPAFWMKMALLLIAIIFHFTFHKRVAYEEPPAHRNRARWTACLSLVLWTSVALAGKAIAIFQPPEEPIIQSTVQLHHPPARLPRS
jgi:uncharacterized membrane protein SirB2